MIIKYLQIEEIELEEIIIKIMTIFKYHNVEIEFKIIIKILTKINNKEDIIKDLIIIIMKMIRNMDIKIIILEVIEIIKMIIMVNNLKEIIIIIINLIIDLKDLIITKIKIFNQKEDKKNNIIMMKNLKIKTIDQKIITIIKIKSNKVEIIEIITDL